MKSRTIGAGARPAAACAGRRRGWAQRGFGGFLLVALIAGMAAAAGLFTFYRNDPVQAQSERTTTDVLAQAKQALIGYTVRRGGATGTARPGELPCPDRDGDGESDNCTLARDMLGRLPWKTLGIPEPRDAGGEPLWYSISTRFRDMGSMPGTWTTVQKRINSDTRGTITVKGADGSTLTTEAVAVIFAVGGALGSQNRSGVGAVLCNLAGLSVLRQFCAINYLDATEGTNNAASTSGPFIAGQPTATFNDRLVYLSVEEIMPAVEMRIGAELKELLLKYRATSICKCYPWADNWPYSGGIADTGQNRGRFPSLPEPEQWGTNKIPALPQWVAANDWHNFFWYSVGRQNSHMDGSQSRRCRTCSDHPMLKVTDPATNAFTWVSALLFTPGPPIDRLGRLAPPSGQSSRTNNVELYLEDPENRDGAYAKACPDVDEIGDATPASGNFKGATSCDEYVIPRSRALNRDRLFTVGVADPAVCAASAQTLLNNLTCHTTGSNVKAACQTAVTNLDTCPCLEGAREMLQVPCANSTSPPQCQAAIAQVRTCIP